MPLYNLKSSIDTHLYIITKFTNDLNVEASYSVGNTICECPAGHRPTCRHRQMLPTLAPRVDTAWFYCFETKSWEDPTGSAQADEDQVSNLSGATALSVPSPQGMQSPTVGQEDMGSTPTDLHAETSTQSMLNAAPSAETPSVKEKVQGFRRRI